MKFLQKHKENFFLVLILLIAAFLRLYRISDYLTFLGDEGRDVLVVYNILHGHLTLLGPTSSVGNFFTGPVYYYLMAPFLWLFHYDPTGPAVMVALFGIFTVWFVYKLGSEFFNKATGIIAAGLYAISPLVLTYSRSSWNPNLMPIATLVILYLLYQAVKKKSIKLFLFSGITYGIAMQLHYVLVFVGVMIAFYVLFWQRKNIRTLITSYATLFVGFLIGLSPFLAFEARHGFQNIRNIFIFVFNPQGKDAIATHMGFIPTVSNVFFRLFGRLATDYPPPEQVSTQAHPGILLWFLATLILAIGSVIVFLYQLPKTKGRDKKLQWTILLTWLIFGVGLFGFYRKNIYDYYFEFMFPLPFFLVGNFFTTLWENKKGIRYVTPIALLALVVINLQDVPFRHSANKQLQQTQEIAQFVLSKTDNKPYNFALISAGNSDQAYRYFFKIWGHDPEEIGHDNGKGTNITNQLLVICEDPVCQPLGDASWEIAGFGRAEITDEWTVSVVKVYKLSHYAGK